MNVKFVALVLPVQNVTRVVTLTIYMAPVGRGSGDDG